MFKKILVVGLVAIFLPPLFYAFMPTLPNWKNLTLKAAIIDTLDPNPLFNKTVTRILEEAGFTVDHFGDRDVTVKFYQQLPSTGYAIIILRVHGATAALTTATSFFTSEEYNPSSHTFEQLTGEVTQVAPTGQNQTYFGVTPSAMKGRFQNTIIIAMCCNSYDEYLAETLVQRGASAYFGWRNWVRDSRNDRAVIYLLEHLLSKHQTVEEALTETMEKLGPDITYNSILLYYPSRIGNYTIWDIVNSSDTNSTETEGG